jgi:hypothetical protein
MAPHLADGSAWSGAFGSQRFHLVTPAPAVRASGGPLQPANSQQTRDPMFTHTQDGGSLGEVTVPTGSGGRLGMAGR